MKALSHPGLLVIRRPYDVKAKRFATSIPVDEVRRLRSFLAHRAAGDGWRVVIVDEANELNVNAANALLKSLEEPPTRTVFLLVSSAPGRLVPTIRSRYAHACLGAARRERPARGGHPGTRGGRDEGAACKPTGRRSSRWPRVAPDACSGCSPPAAANCRFASPSCSSLLPKVDWRAVHTLADELQPIAAQPRFELFFELLLASLGRLIRAAASGEGAPRRPRAGRPGSSAIPGLPRLPPCGKE